MTFSICATSLKKTGKSSIKFCICFLLTKYPSGQLQE